jgi:hypothetical protein
MKQCPQCRRSYDDSQNFCLMDGTPLINEPEEETVIRRTAARPRKSRWLLWMALAGLIIGMGTVVGGLLIYNLAGRRDNTLEAKGNSNAGSSPASTISPAPKVTPSPESANSSSITDSEDEVTPIDWSTAGVGFKNDVGTIYKFQCPANGTGHPVWGSDIYTADSSICTAAVHAGLFSLAEFRPGRLTYGSTERNGIKSSTFGEYSRSFVVR